jgi:cellulose synthase/poly-beta-1,6-N-acetylglucosamine synthase-like glycosyltransferase/peptidoglycan/xylan/chitin deacetylase (PgdA/CDA1 family)
LILVMVSLILALSVVGFAGHAIGATSTAQRAAPAAGLQQVGPIVDLAGTELRSFTPPDKEVALTFDDGPDPHWTPQILAVLQRHHVPATFFVVGANVLAHPGLVRAELAAGDDVGTHTFTHSDLSAVAGWRANLELGLTETALAGAIGRTTSLLRLPYSSTSVDLSDRQLAAARRAARYGYLLVTATRDGEDWQRPGVGAILARATPLPGQGAIILLHDAGGDRSETVAALDPLITNLQGAGYRFETVSQLGRLPARSANRSLRTVAHWQGFGLLVVYRVGRIAVATITVLLIALGVLALLRTLIVVALAGRHRRGTPRSDDTSFDVPVSVIVPAYNEAVGIADTLGSLRRSAHGALMEIIVVDDGSTDSTADIVEQLHLPGVRVVRQPNQGKAAALNTGLAHAVHDIVVMVDGDTVFEPEAVSRLVRPLRAPAVGAVSGNAKVGNRHRLVGHWQHIEYVMGFNLDRRMYDVVGCIPTVPGAIGAFRREALDEVCGVSDDTLAEDTDLTMAIIRAGWQVVYEPDAIAYTEAPSSLRALWRQRYRWSYGTMQAMWKHRGAIREQAHRLGRIGLPYLLLFQILLPLVAPVVDVVAIYGLVFLDPVPVLAAWLVFLALQAATAVYAFRLDNEPVSPLWALPLQQFVYRQLMYLVVIQSVASAVNGVRLHWHKLDRTGMTPALSGRPVDGG